MRKFLRRYRLSLLLVCLAVAAWPVAYYILTGYRTPDVPYVTTPPAVVEAMVDLAALRPGDVVYDLGCGDGRLVIAAARRHPEVRGVGIDIDPARTAEAREAAAAAGVADRVRVVRNDLFREDLTPATVVLMYLMPGVNERLVPEFDKLRPGSRIVSHWYRVPGLRPAEVRQVNAGGMDHPVYLYVTPLVRE